MTNRLKFSGLCFSFAVLGSTASMALPALKTSAKPAVSTVPTVSMTPVRNCPLPWRSAVGNSNDCARQKIAVGTWDVVTGWRRSVTVNIRNGYLTESPNVPFRGNVIYYEGLGDSMVNHMPLFRKLTDAGYRVIAFDYMGQGGSAGSMSATRILAMITLGDKIWNLHARDLKNYPKKNVIGWSTGGLIAYAQAQVDAGRGIGPGVGADVDNVVLIAPGLVPNEIVGEQRPLSFDFNLITLSSLTSAKYASPAENPHIDPIKPTSPLQVKPFALNLMTQARACRGTPIPARVKGFVLLSGHLDSYVDAKETFKVLKQRAPHFTVQQYPHALHEIDNESEPTRTNAQTDILNFLNANN